MEVLDGPVPVKDTENNSTLRIVFVFIITIYFELILQRLRITFDNLQKLK